MGVIDHFSDWSESVGKSGTTTPPKKLDDIVETFLKQELGIDMHAKGNIKHLGLVEAAYVQAALTHTANSKHAGPNTKLFSEGNHDFRIAVMDKLKKEDGLDGQKLLDKGIAIESKFIAAIKSSLGLAKSIA